MFSFLKKKDSTCCGVEIVEVKEEQNQACCKEAELENCCDEATSPCC
ncbi:hypothetical protein LG311_16830 [Sutcliffiella horikoshii]